MPGGGSNQRANRPNHPHFQAPSAGIIVARIATVSERENHAALEGLPKSRDPFDGCALLEAEVAGGELDPEILDGVEAAEDLGGGIGRAGFGWLSGGGKRKEVVEGREEGFEEGGEEGDAVMEGGVGGGDDPVDAKEEGVGLGDEGVEALGNGSAAEEGLDVRNPVEDEKENRVG